MERDPAKRRVKPAQTLIDFDDLGESSDDSDFRIEDHCDESDLDDSMDSDDGNKQGNYSWFSLFIHSLSCRVVNF